MNYNKIIERYEKCFDLYGDTHLGVEWKTKESANKRYEIMLQLMKNKGSLLDFGCGLASLLDYAKDLSLDYTGLDISHKYTQFCKEKYPKTRFIRIDVLNENFTEVFDYIIMNGVFTCKDALEFNEMLEYFKCLTAKLFNYNTKIGLAFNVMSEYVDYEKEYLFHLPISIATNFITKLTKNFVIRHDYGLYEYTVYLYK